MASDRPPPSSSPSSAPRVRSDPAPNRSLIAPHPAAQPHRQSSMSDEHAELQRLGAKAAARGEHALTNPMLDAVNQPDATGESAKTWSDRRDAWLRGHLAQQTDLPDATPRDP